MDVYVEVDFLVMIHEFFELTGWTKWCVVVSSFVEDLPLRRSSDRV